MASLRILVASVLLHSVICRPQTSYYSLPQLPYYTNNYYEQAPFSYQPQFYPNTNYYQPPAVNYDDYYQIPPQTNYPFEFDFYQNYDQLNEVSDFKSPIQIIPSKFPPRVEQIVERIQNYFSTYAEVEAPQNPVKKPATTEPETTTPSSTTPKDEPETTTNEKEEVTTENTATEPSTNDIDGPTNSEDIDNTTTETESITPPK